MVGDEYIKERKGGGVLVNISEVLRRELLYETLRHILTYLYC